jgi:hypothetical protein
MEEMYPYYDIASPPLHAVFGAARCFGLTEAEVWHAVGDALGDVDLDVPLSDSMDEITAQLARRILSKQRRVITEQRRAASDEL